MKQLLIAVGLALAVTGVAVAKEETKETKEVKVNGKTQEVRVPKSAKIDCKVEANKDKTECKKQSKEMPKIEKPVVEKKAEPAKK